MKENGIMEMTAMPTPEWIKKAGKEIQERYNLDYVDSIYIAGIICKYNRINNEKSRSNTSEIPANP